MIRTNQFILFATTWLLTGLCFAQKTVNITVENRSGLNREELAETPVSGIKDRLNLQGSEAIVVTNAAGEALPSQITHDGLLLFPVKLQPHESQTFTLLKGEAEPTDTLVQGAFYPERKDDLAWENDRTAYRAYGPALQRSGEKAYGYDVWTKSVPYPVVRHRYDLTMNPKYGNEVAALKKFDKKAAQKLNSMLSFHIDHGNGMDRYAVGPTLGCGTNALVDANGAIVYPWAFRTYEILDNGPLRFTVRFEYTPFDFEGDKNVTEVRTVSLDLGLYLNKTIINYRGLKQNSPIAVGLVIHADNPKAYVASAKEGYIGYEDLTERPKEGNGQIYVGAVMPEKQQKAEAVYFSPEESKARGNASGHVLSTGTYKAGKSYTYYWGSGWSKGGMPSLTEWESYLQRFALGLKRPLKVSVK